jgi:replicative DNA helicase
MFEISDNYLSLMNSVLIKRLRSAADNNELLSFAIDGSGWPECAAKAIMLDMNNALKFGFDGAKAQMWAKHGSYLNVARASADSQLLEREKLVEKLTLENKLHWAGQMLTQLQDRPELIDQLILDYQSKRHTGVRKLNLKDQIEGLVRENERRIKSGDSKVVIPGFEKLSEMIQGWNPQALTQITAMTGVGKTNLMVSLAQQASKVMDVLFINMEMGDFDFGSRFIHNGCAIKNNHWREGSYLNQKTANIIVDYGKIKAEQFDIFYTDGRALTIGQIEHEIYSVFNGKNKGIVFVDYDQKILSDSKSDEWKALLEAMIRLEEVAKRCNVHIVIAAQANEDGRAKASRRSEQPMTNVLSFYREPNGIDPNLDKYFLRAFKTRYGSLGCLEMGADLATSRIWEMDYVRQQQAPSEAKGGWLK